MGTDASIKNALNTLAGIATHDGAEHEVYLKCAPYGNGYIIDLCDDEWRVIEVTPTGWRVLDKSPVKFKRTSAMKSLLISAPGGELSGLWSLVNITIEKRELVIAWVLEAFRPETPLPVLEIAGEQGCAKSTTQSRLRDFIDPLLTAAIAEVLETVGRGGRFYRQQALSQLIQIKRGVERDLHEQ